MHTSVISAYVIGIIVCLILLLIASLITNCIPNDISSHPRHNQKRRIVFWICGVMSFILTFAACYLIVYNSIRIPSVQNKYMIAMSISSILSFVIYVALGLFISSSVFKYGNVSSWCWWK